ncbi:MAG: sigma-70 family RNA polymerase sigma factor [Muribaculaceae bacterium]|nr:sigma-70 family RNA polymerase sigma factor [Muribaculaceae bacterium]
MDKKRFEIELLPCYKRIYSICVAIVRDRDEAADAVQETYARLWKRRDELDELESAEAYAVKTAKRICIDKIRSREVVSEEHDAGVTSDTDRLENADELRLIKTLMDKLPLSQRKAVELSAFGGCSNDEIAELTGESPANVRQLLSRGRKKLKELYNHYTR